MTLLASLLAILLSACAPEAPRPQTSLASNSISQADLAPFRGTFRFVGGPRERARVKAAIERSVASLPAFHDLARRRLTAANTIPATVSMAMEGEDLVVVYGGNEPQRAPLDGSVREWRNDEGDTSNLKHELHNGKLVQTTWSDGGRRVMVWSYDAEDGVLRVHNTLSSPQLPVPVRYRLTFER